MFRNRAVSLALAGLLLWVTACSTYGSTEPEFIRIAPSEVEDYGRIRVTTASGQTVTMEDPRLENDSVTSANVGAIPLSQVTEIEAFAKTNKSGDTLLIVGALVVAVAAVGGLILLASRTSDDDGQHCELDLGDGNIYCDPR